MDIERLRELQNVPIREGPMMPEYKTKKEAIKGLNAHSTDHTIRVDTKGEIHHTFKSIFGVANDVGVATKSSFIVWSDIERIYTGDGVLLWSRDKTVGTVKPLGEIEGLLWIRKGRPYVFTIGKGEGYLHLLQLLYDSDAVHNANDIAISKGIIKYKDIISRTIKALKLKDHTDAEKILELLLKIDYDFAWWERTTINKI